MSDALVAVVWIDPGRRSGEPCIYGHRISVEIVADMVLYSGEGEGVHAAMDTWKLTRREVLGACWFAAKYEGRRFRIWKQWRKDWSGEMWRGSYDIVPDPPIKDPA